MENKKYDSVGFWKTTSKASGKQYYQGQDENNFYSLFENFEAHDKESKKPKYSLIVKAKDPNYVKKETNHIQEYASVKNSVKEEESVPF